MRLNGKNQVLLYVELGQIPKSVELEELSDGTECSAKEQCEKDGNAKCRDIM
jgi:hypothetical protein